MITTEDYWIADSGHSWLAVPKKRCKGLDISAYSYQDKGIAYLEEDCDAPTYFRHYGISPSVRQQMRVVHIDGEWQGRNTYARFTK